MKFIIVALSTLLLSASASAAEVPENFRNRLNAFLGAGFAVESIADSPMPGIYEVLAGGRYLYVSVQDEMLMIGNIYDTDRGVSLGEEKQSKIAAAEVAQSPVEEMIVFKGDESKRHITVFTDMDCGYCRKLHQEVPALNQAGVDVRYMMYPAITAKSLPKAIGVWCAEDQQAALSAAKRGENVPEGNCDNPVDAQFKLGQRIGVRGTPYLVLDDGTVIPGYVPASDLITRLGLN